MMERLSTLGTESVIIVTLMASTSVLLLGKHGNISCVVTLQSRK